MRNARTRHCTHSSTAIPRLHSSTARRSQTLSMNSKIYVQQKKNLRPLRRMRRRNSMQLDRSSIFFYLFREKNVISCPHGFVSSMTIFFAASLPFNLLIESILLAGKGNCCECWGWIVKFHYDKHRMKKDEWEEICVLLWNHGRRRRWIKSIFYFSSLNASKLFFPSQQFSSIQWKVVPFPVQMKGFRRRNFAFAAAMADDDE